MQGGRHAVDLPVKAFPVAVRGIQPRHASADRLAAFARKDQLALRAAKIGKRDRLEVFIMLQQALQTTVYACRERLLVDERPFPRDQDSSSA